MRLRSPKTIEKKNWELAGKATESIGRKSMSWSESSIFHRYLREAAKNKFKMRFPAVNELIAF